MFINFRRRRCQALKLDRKGALHLSRLHTGLSNREIGERFGGIEAAGVSRAASRMKEEIVSDKKLSKLVNNLESSFKA